MKAAAVVLRVLSSARLFYSWKPFLTWNYGPPDDFGSEAALTWQCGNASGIKQRVEWVG